MDVYKGKKYGVKRIKNYFAVEETDVLGDISKYDFILKDRCTDNYNGNTSYAAYVMTELCDEPVFNGWRIKELKFPGSWFGQGGSFVLIDKFGKEYESFAFYARKWYHNMQEDFISDCLVEVLKFTINNYSAKYLSIIKGFSISSNYDEKGYNELIERIRNYIQDYKDILASLKEENKPNEMIEDLNKAFHEQIKKCYPFDLNI